MNRSRLLSAAAAFAVAALALAIYLIVSWP